MPSIAPGGAAGSLAPVVPRALTLEAMLTAALETLDAALRHGRPDSVAVGYSRSGALRLTRHLGNPLARGGIGLSRSELRARGVDCWYQVAFRPFRLCHGVQAAAEPQLSASAVAVDLSACPGHCLGLLGLIRPGGFVAMPATLVAVEATGERFCYRTNVVAH